MIISEANHGFYLIIVTKIIIVFLRELDTVCSEEKFYVLNLSRMYTCIIKLNVNLDILCDSMGIVHKYLGGVCMKIISYQYYSRVDPLITYTVIANYHII